MLTLLKIKNIALIDELTIEFGGGLNPVSYKHLRAHETGLDLVWRLLLEKKKKVTPLRNAIHWPPTETQPL